MAETPFYEITRYKVELGYKMRQEFVSPPTPAACRTYFFASILAATRPPEAADMVKKVAFPSKITTPLHPRLPQGAEKKFYSVISLHFLCPRMVNHPMFFPAVKVEIGKNGPKKLGGEEK